MKRIAPFRLVLPAFVPAAALLTAALSGAAQAQEPKTTFTIVNPGPIVGKNYNPFTPGAQHLAPTLSAIYETLFYVNANSGKVEPVLGTKYVWSGDNKTLTVTTRDGVKWTDGQAFTAADVAFTFNYIKTNPALDLTGVWKSGLNAVKSSGNTVTFTFDKANTPFFFYVAGLPIVPQHLWASVKDPVTYTNSAPVGTGPFVAEQYSTQAIRALKNPNYWMKGKPAVDAVVWLPASGNDTALLTMLKGQADYAYLSIPDPNKSYKDKGAQYSYWYVPNSVNALYFNTTKAPFSDAAFRRAVALAVDTKDVAQKAYSGVIPAADPTGITPAQLAQWKPTLPAGLAPTYNPAAADAALTAAGYKKNAAGVRLGKDGQPLPSYRILVGAGWTDFITMAQVVGENLKALGISTTIDQQVFAGYSGSLQSATYDMGISWGWGTGPTPYNLYYQSFDPSVNAPAGKIAPSDLAHYTSAPVTGALDAFSSTSTLAAQKKAVATMVTQVLRDTPWVPLTARTSFNVYNTSKLTGFPTDADPYNAGDASDTAGARPMLLNVKPK